MDEFENIRKQILEILEGRKVPVSKVEAEGPEIAIYTTKPELFFDDKSIISEIAEKFKKRINVRSEKTSLMEPAEALTEIKKIIPEDADIKGISFDPVFCEVIIEAIKPGVVIGKQGMVSKEIIKRTGWIPKILRAPTEPSEILKGIRAYLLKNSSERKTFLKNVAKKIYGQSIGEKDWVRVTALGSFREVGRSCILLDTPDTKILLDCGINTADRNEENPYLGSLRFPLDELDAVIISHAHVDHCGFLPYLFKVGYRGPVYCTEPTRDLMALLQFDLIDVNVKSGREPPYSEEDIKECIKHCITRNYREVTDIAPGIRMTFHDASHILGSASVHLHIGDGKQNLVYSADMKFGFMRMFNNADINYPRLDTLVIESTYAKSKQLPQSRQNAEARLVEVINETAEKGGITLIPVFSVGRAQEVMLVLEEYYRQGRLKTDKIFIDGMTRQASAIHTVYPEYMKLNIKNRVLQNNSPFLSKLFVTVDNGDNSRDKVKEMPGSVILASSGMLTGGPSVRYFYDLANDEKNTLVFVGYQGKGSLGNQIQSGLRSMPVTDENGKNKLLEIKMRIETIDVFSGHSYRPELINYISALHPKPKTIMVNHGDSCQEFAKQIESKFYINTVAIQNLESLRLV